jgi:hypothetical protein
MHDRAPGFLGFIYASIGLLVLTGLLLFFSGLGLLRMRTWAWWGSIIYAVVTILNQFVGIYINVAYTNPVMADYYRDLETWQQQLTPNQPPMPNPAMAIWDNPVVMVVASLMGVVMNCAYPVVLLAVLLRPRIRAAFRDQPAADSEEVLDVLPASDVPRLPPAPQGGT